MLEKAVITAPSNTNGYLIDGFPRDTIHGPLFEEQVRQVYTLIIIN